MWHRRMSAILAAIGIWTCSSPLIAQTQDDLFNGDIFHEVRLYMAPQDFDTFKQTNITCEKQEIEELEGEVISPLPRVICWFPVEFHWKFNTQDITLPEVAIESHGRGSRNNIKPSFKIDFSRYESRLNFLGLRYLVLRANTQDASQMHERVSMAFFRLLGIPASREVHTRLYLNDQYFGVYTIVEDVDPVFLQQRFGENGGYLYSYQWTFPWAFNDLGTASSHYSPLPLKPENNLTHFDPSPIPYMVQTINEAPDAQFSAAVSSYLDLNAMFREIAAESFINEEDGIIGEFAMNNFYLYRFENTVRYTVIPWDKSNTFWPSVYRDIFFNFETNVLTSRALSAAPDLISLYKDYLRQAAVIAGGPGGWLEQEITREYNQIREAVYEDPNKICRDSMNLLLSCSNDQFEDEVSNMIQFARIRAGVVLAQLP